MIQQYLTQRTLLLRDSLTFPQLSAVAAALKSIDYNVAMTFILNNNNNNNMRAAAILIFDKCLYLRGRIWLITARRLSAYM